MPSLEDEDRLVKIIGPRCQTTDYVDFPDLKSTTRCPSCEVWEAVDAYVASTVRQSERDILAQRIQKLELLLALADMYGQYCSGSYGHDFMSAGETAIELLEDYNLATEAGGLDEKQIVKVQKILEDYQRQYARLAMFQKPEHTGEGEYAG